MGLEPSLLSLETLGGGEGYDSCLNCSVFTGKLAGRSVKGSGAVEEPGRRGRETWLWMAGDGGTQSSGHEDNW